MEDDMTPKEAPQLGKYELIEEFAKFFDTENGSTVVGKLCVSAFREITLSISFTRK